MQLSDRDVAAIRAWAESHVEIAQVWLFGSRARGEATTKSDVDLAVSLRASSAKDRQVIWSFSNREWRDELKLEHDVQLELLEPDFDIYAEVKREGIKLYPAGRPQ